MYKELLIEMLIFVLFIFFDLDDIGILAGIGKKNIYIYIFLEECVYNKRSIIVCSQYMILD